MLHNTLVNATDLNSWSDRNTSKSELPLLVRKLIQATISKIKFIEIRTEEGTAIGGWDGILEVITGNEYVPNGKSLWEFGTNKKQKAKADEDYEKRKKDPGKGISPSDTTYIYVNSRRWKNKGSWAAERKKEKFWKDVKAYDADDLQAWLETAPSTHIWITRKTGKRPETAIDLEHFSARWSAESNPPIKAKIVLPGRDESRERLSKWLNGPATIFSLKADSRDEALMFLYATIEALPAASRESIFSKATVVESLSAWRELSLSKTKLLLIPIFDPRIEIASATANGHHVFVPFGGSEVASVSESLSKLRVDGTRAVLKEMGFNEERCNSLAAQWKKRPPSIAPETRYKP